MCTIIKCSKVNSSLLLSKRDSLPTKTSEKFKIPPVYKNMSSKALGGKKRQGKSHRKVLKTTQIVLHTPQHNRLLPPVSKQHHGRSRTTGGAFYQNQAFVLLTNLGWGGKHRSCFVRGKLLLKSKIINFIPHLCFHCLTDHQQHCARNALIA